MNKIFITFEGPEGSGKTTIINMVKQYFMVNNIDHIATREPGGIMIAEKIRELILDVDHTMMDSKTEALLYAASRRQHLVERVIPALNNGQIVICDRFLDSSLAYQGYARGLGIKEVLDINQFAIDGVMPSMTIFFDITPELGLSRIVKDNRSQDRLDLESMNFHHQVYDGYQKVVKMFPERIKVVDASLSIDEVFNQVIHLILDHIGRK